MTNMKKMMTFLLTMLGAHFTSACGQHAYEDAEVSAFAAFINTPDVQLLDVRTAEEYAEGHIAGALLCDVKQSDFSARATALLTPGKPVAVYCRSGRRSATAALMLADRGFKVVNLKGGIIAWQANQMPVATEADMGGKEVDVFTTKSGKSIAFHALMHASIRIVYDNKEIEIDPVSRLGNRTTDYSALPKADYIFVTHEHPDHFDQHAIHLLTSDTTLLITNKRCADMLGYGRVMANGDKIAQADNFTVEAVPAYNVTEGRTQFHPKGRDNGFIIDIDGLRIYIAGDTEDIEEMAGFGRIDIAFLPCNQPYTMTPDQLVRAARAIKPSVLFPYHYGQTDLTQLSALLKDDNIDLRIRHYE